MIMYYLGIGIVWLIVTNVIVAARDREALKRMWRMRNRSEAVATILTALIWVLTWPMQIGRVVARIVCP